MSKNRLGDEGSPYLQLHKDNPVHWYAWGEDAFRDAEGQNKPILLSIGYSACHWCHVMNHESFADEETAAQMNAQFINIKVDREERPDVDQVYQAAANALGHTGGWPLTMFLTPKGVPFFASTYSPKEERLGMPAFRTVLASVDRSYRENPQPISESAERCVQQLNQIFNRDMRGRIDGALLDTAALRIAQRFDIFFGGPTGQMKFPTVTALEVMWRAFLRSGSPQFMQIFSTTLDNMLLGGLYDHIGGGFARYCVDERWTVPHFEKMLYDNAMILDLMVTVWQFNRNALCRDRIFETVEFLLRDLKSGDAFASSLDADSEGHEGKYYVWSEAEIDAALSGTFVQRFKAAYNVRAEGNFEGKNVLQRLGASAPYPQSDADEALLRRQRELLLAERSKRVAPMRDEKVLADWNGLALAALASAGAVFQKPEWIAAAVRCFDFVVRSHGEDGRLHHAWHDGKRGALGFADDYAHMIRAAITLWELVGGKQYLDHALAWSRTLNEHFWDHNLGGYFFTSDEADPLIVRTRMVYDQPVACANSVMIAQLAKLFLATADQQHAQRADQLIRAFAGESARAFMSMASYFSSVEVAVTGLQIVIIGAQNNPKTHELASAVLGRSLPNRLLVVAPPDDALPEGHPAHGKPMQNGQPTAYICQRGTCSAPITNPVTLSQVLQLPARPPQGQSLQ
ncbi:MAG: thioredoxin domain-containing protein [Alphaproteobacteria bacterium]|nr:thioredoxin domain-containing protein [Alphaproteobacteria bacterium]